MHCVCKEKARACSASSPSQLSACQIDIWKFIQKKQLTNTERIPELQRNGLEWRDRGVVSGGFS